MNLTNPVVLSFVPGKGDITLNNQILTIPEQAKWNDFKSNVSSALSDPDVDYAVLSFKGMGTDIPDNTLKSLNIKAKTILKDASNKGLRVFNRFDDKMYFLNPSFDELRAGSGYAPSDEDVLAVRDAYETKYDWQHYQSDVIDRLAVDMPLTTGQKFESSNHTAMLTDPSRGLQKRDLDKFFSWKSNATVIPELVQSDMVGIPSMKGTSFDDISLEFNGKPLSSSPIHIKTIGMQGAMIPMSNPRGDTAKYQIATDVSPINVFLKARAADGISIQKSEYFNKKQGRFGTYNFKLDGEPSELTVSGTKDNVVTFVDTKGEFDVHMKQDVKPLLVARGYEIPDMIDTLKPNANAKYIWMSPGTMIGSPDINNNKVEGMNRITPSEAGFIKAKQPTNGSDEYLVLVAEGALKGVITAKYLTAKDVNGKSVADLIAKDRGLIVAQVPGVAESFVKSVDRIYDEDKVVGTYIAMDADGRDNLAVARGIHGAYDELSKHGPVKVMSWNPEQKGIDDALIAIAAHDITVDDMELHFGSPETLFPLDKATAPNPYKLDGSRANSQSWVSEYGDSKAAHAKKIKEMQSETASKQSVKEPEDTATEPESIDGLEELSNQSTDELSL